MKRKELSGLKRHFVPLIALLLAGCGTVFPPRQVAPQECHFGDAEVLWSGHASLNQLGLESDVGATEQPVDIFITAEPNQGTQRRFCAVLPEGDQVVGRYTFEGDVPDDWEPPTPAP